MTNPDEPVVLIIDDDALMRQALENLLQSVGHVARAFPSTEAFLTTERPDAPGCLVLDVRLPGQSGLELQRRLSAAGVDLPIIFITGHGDVPMSVSAMKAGAIEFLTKPFRRLWSLFGRVNLRASGAAARFATCLRSSALARSRSLARASFFTARTFALASRRLRQRSRRLKTHANARSNQAPRSRVSTKTRLSRSTVP
jgi:FixJ family two-component response regulator